MAQRHISLSRMPERFWLEAVNTACHTINRLYLHRLLKKTSYELLTSKSPMFHILESLVENALFLLKEVENPNLLLRLQKAFLLGYDSNTRAYRVFNKSSGLVEVSCDVVFDGYSAPYLPLQPDGTM